MWLALGGWLLSHGILPIVIIAFFCLELNLFLSRFSFGLFGCASLSLLHVLRVLLHEVPHQVEERLILINHVRVLGLGHGLSSFGILLIVVEGLACNLEVLHEQLEVLGTLGDCLPR